MNLGWAAVSVRLSPSQYWSKMAVLHPMLIEHIHNYDDHVVRIDLGSPSSALEKKFFLDRSNGSEA